MSRLFFVLILTLLFAAGHSFSSFGQVFRNKDNTIQNIEGPGVTAQGDIPQPEGDTLPCGDEVPDNPCPGVPVDGTFYLVLAGLFLGFSFLLTANFRNRKISLK
jgi:hypothetical protein